MDNSGLGVRMMSSLGRGIAGAAAAALVAGAIPFAAAVPAQARPTHCVEWLEAKGYKVGGGVIQACKVGGEFAGSTQCRFLLTGLGVSGDDSTYACQLARSSDG